MKKIILFISLLLLLSISIQAQSFYNTEITASGTSTDNLFKNSSNISDHLASIKGSINLYPVQFSQFNIFSEYTNYGKNPDLSNIKYGGGISLLPLSDSSAFTLFLNMNYKKYSYKNALTTNSTEFSNENIDGIFSLGYQLNEKTNLRAGFNYTSTGYTSDSDFVSDNNVNNIFTGLNFSFLSSNSIDLEGGYSFSKYDYLPEYDTLGFHYGLAGRNAYTFLKESDLSSKYISIRYSRPIGHKTGISISYSYRNFTDTKDSALILGSTTGYLSPWVNSYEGNSTLVKFKTYLVPYTIINFGAGYWNSSYLKTLEGVESIGFDMQPFISNLTINGVDRNDDKYRIYMTVAIPIVTSSGRLFEPSFNIDYTDNESSIDYYTYSDFTVTINLNIK